MEYRKAITPLIHILACAFLLAGCSGGWSPSEKDVIGKGNAVMRVLTIEDREDSLFLRTPCKDLTIKQIRSDEYAILAGRMLVTVTSPEQDGVGIAGPQVGIGRRIVAVQRFDKPGEPFEVYPNIRVTARRGEPEPGPEGCLSVPGRRGTVARPEKVRVHAQDRKGKHIEIEGEGLLARCLCHELDHLDGVLYVDKMIEDVTDKIEEETEAEA